MFRRRQSPRNSGLHHKQPNKRVHRAILEALESRQLLSVDMVTNLNDSGAGSLRQTIAGAASGDTIEFASNLDGGTITLTSGQLQVAQNLTISGPGSASLTVSGNSTSTVFNIAGGVTTSISGLTITKGFGGGAGSGGDIYNSGTLSLSGDVVSSGKTELGGGIYNNGGNVTIASSTISANTAFQQGGGVLNASGGVINITGSTITGNVASEEAGGGISNEIGTVTITGSTVSSNTAGTDGGGIANEAFSTLVVDSTSILSNTATMYGGGILNFDSASLTITDGSSITSNIADDVLGGGLFNYLGNANISSSTFTSNASKGSSDDVALGGAIADFEGVINITGSTFNTNGTGGAVFEEAGGALYLIADTATINSCTFNGNSAQAGGAIFADSSSSLVMYNSTLENNTVSNEGYPISVAGAGVYLGGASAYFANSTFSGNTDSAGSGGAIAAFAPLTCANCTIASNSASSTGGGLFIEFGVTVTIYNTIVASNFKMGHSSTASNISGTLDFNIGAGVTHSSNNLISDTSTTGGLSNGTNGNITGANPNLGSLTITNGGPTPTMALMTGSPAIDKGNNALAVDANGNPLIYDQRGAPFTRIVNGTVDIGAYEVQSGNNNSVLKGNGASITKSTGSASSGTSGSSVSAISFASVLGFSGGNVTPNFILTQVSAVSPASAPYTPAQIRSAYAVNDISFNGTAGTGSGETIAIVDAFNDPDIISDANTFSSMFGLPQFNSGGPTLTVLNETGGTPLPANATAGDWDIEESLDVEYAHAIAPDANIILFEASSASGGDLNDTVQTAADYAGVSVVSMSWGEPQLNDFYEGNDEPGSDSIFTTPTGHQGVTFVASTGDTGAVGVNYPGTSPNVVTAGGTSLTIGTDGSYLSESAWSGGGGGASIQEVQPSYQSGTITAAVLAAPDVSMDADPQTGVFVYDSYNQGGYFGVGGTSLAAPMWAALFAIVNQGRAIKGESSLDGPSQSLPMLYALPSADFHDVTTGDNGYSALVGYDLATGLGTPIASLLVPDLAGFAPVATWTGAVSNDWYTPANWSIDAVPTATTDVIIDSGTPTATVGFSVATLTINGGKLQLGVESGASTMTSLVITGSGTFDLANNHIYIDFGSNTDPASSIYGDLSTGYAQGAWNGVGIDSSSAAANPGYALGYSDGVDGVVSGLTSGQIEIAYTLSGDTNLDGKVDISDFNNFSGHFGMPSTRWDQGDFNYSGVVSIADFNLFSGNFGLTAMGADSALPVVNLAPSTLTMNETTRLALVSQQSVIASDAAAVSVSTPVGKTHPRQHAPKYHTNTKRKIG